MKLRYLGSHVIALPISPGVVQIWRKGETHEVDSHLWIELKQRKDVASLISKKALVEGPEGTKVIQKIELKAEEVKAPIEPEKKEAYDSLSAQVDRILKANYKKAIKEVEECYDMNLLNRLAKLEDRPSVIAALKKRGV